MLITHSVIVVETVWEGESSWTWKGGGDRERRIFKNGWEGASALGNIYKVARAMHHGWGRTRRLELALPALLSTCD
jgi:hypothetical protein